MTDSKELRLGNYGTDESYDVFKRIIKVESINDKGINLEIEDDGRYPEIANYIIEPEYRFDTLYPIPLTKDWLLRFGFKKQLDSSYEKNDISLFLDKRFKTNLYLQTNDSSENFKWFSFERKIEYIHELQNLYFALTREELTLNPTKNAL